MDKFIKNRECNQEEIRQKKTVLDSYMQSLIVTLSSRCNLDCIMCEVRRSKWDIPEKTLHEVIELFPYLERIIWQGGEPFLLPYFSDIFDKAAKFKNLKQTIVTNGLLITEEWAEKLARNFVELTFSIDGLNQEVYERIRERASFSQLMKGVAIMRASRRKFNFPGMSLRLHTVIMRSNYRDIEGFIEFAHENGFDAIHFIAMLGNQSPQENIFYPEDREALDFLEGIRQHLDAKAKSYGIELLNALPRRKRQECNGCPPDSGKEEVSLPQEMVLDCLMPWQQLNIDPGGEVRPGCLCLKSVGSVFTQSLKELWNSPRTQEYRRKLLDRDVVSICQTNCLSVQQQESRKKK
ncbi:MAG: radical SAM protein [Candidatus Omnitrophica bacterium]|nr:radical SAM protein [Candidatus Omnitrophota bacterium]